VTGVTGVARVVFAGLAPLVIEEVVDGGQVIEVSACTPGGELACPDCATASGRVHAWFERVVADVPVDGRPVRVRLRLRRLRCVVPGCKRATFREQVAGLTCRYQRRTVRLGAQVGAVVRELAARAGARTLGALGILVSRWAALRALMRVPLADLVVPRVLGVDDFALRKGQNYATVLIDAETGRRVDVLEGRDGQSVADWLRAHPGAQIVTRDGSSAYAEAIRDGAPNAVQVADRWHLWHGLAGAAGKEVGAHCSCWTPAVHLREGKLTQRTQGRWRQVHDLLDAGTGLLATARRLGLSLNTVKRYARASTPERLARGRAWRRCQVDPYREHLRTRRHEDPHITAAQLDREIRDLGYHGSASLVYRYLDQGRHLDDTPSPRYATRLLLTDPDKLTEHQSQILAQVTTACPEMSALGALVRDFAALLAPDPGNKAKLQVWIDQARTTDLPEIHSFTRGLDIDHDAVAAALSTPYHNGRTEGVNNKTKMIKRQMFGRAGFALLRHRILLN
jgi:transposase